MDKTIFRRYSDSFWFAYHPGRPLRFVLSNSTGIWELRTYGHCQLESIHSLYENWDESRIAAHNRISTTYDLRVLWEK